MILVIIILVLAVIILCCFVAHKAYEAGRRESFRRQLRQMMEYKHELHDLSQFEDKDRQFRVALLDILNEYIEYCSTDTWRDGTAMPEEISIFLDSFRWGKHTPLLGFFALLQAVGRKCVIVNKITGEKEIEV